MDKENSTGTYLNSTVGNFVSNDESETADIMMVLSISIASVGAVANFTVVTAFLNHIKLRRKIPNIFIINQVTQE